MKKLCMLFMLIFFFGLSATGYTSEECHLFEDTFEKLIEKPVAELKSAAKFESSAKLQYFQALTGEAIVRVYNGAGDKTRRVSSATIYINGNKVVGPSDFSQNVDYIETKAGLDNGENSLEVRLKSKPGGKINIEIVKPKDLESGDLDCDFIHCNGDESEIPGDNPCTGGNTALCDDNCPNDFNPDQADSDGDGIGDMCDADETYPDAVVATIDIGDGPQDETVSSPSGVAVSLPDGAYVYVTNYNEHTVSVIKTSDNSVIDTINNVGKRPQGIAVTPDGEYVYVTNYAEHTVSVIETSYYTEVKTIDVGMFPYGVSVTPNGAYVYVCNFWSDSVSVIETSSNTVIDTINIDTINNTWAEPYGVSITPDGEYVYVSNHGDDSVSVIETSNNTVIDTINIDTINNMWAEPKGIAVTPDGKYVYVSNYGDDSVSVIETSSNTVIDTINNEGTGPQGIAVTPDSAYVYVNNFYDGNVSVIRTSDNSVIKVIDVGIGPQAGIAISPDGKSVYVGNYGDDTVSVIGLSM